MSLGSPASAGNALTGFRAGATTGMVCGQRQTVEAAVALALPKPLRPKPLWLAHGRRLPRIGVGGRGCSIGGADRRWRVLRRVHVRVLHAQGQEQPARNEKGSKPQKKSRDARSPAVLVAIDIIVLRQLASRSLIHLDTSFLVLCL